LTAALGLAAAGGEAGGPELPLGPPGLSEQRFERQVAPGVHYTRIVRGEVSPRDVYTVDVGFRASRSDAQALADELRADGHDPRVLRISERAPDDPERGPLGWLVRVGDFGTEQEAIALRDRLAAEGYTGTRVIYTGEDGGPTAGPWVVHVLEVEPRRLRAALDAELATGIVPERELLSDLARRTRAVASLNGGYFVIGPADGTPGDLAGISMLEGELVSESVGDRTSLLLSGRRAQVAPVATRGSARAEDGAAREIDGLNRKPGLIRGCGGVGGDLPTESPKHDFTCTDASELILFTDAFGERTEPGEGAEAALDRNGRVLELRETRGGAIPPGGSVLSGTGDGAEWLRSHAQPGSTMSVRTAISGGRGGRRTDIVNGGPRLVRDGSPAINAFAEGFHWPENPEFYYRFGVRRNPRTLAGVTDDGRVLLVAIDGRRPSHSVGASFNESAAVMRALGARDALNLDGGGSTGMTVGQDLVTRPSDATGERPIADAILIGP
ncbi:MAG: phosphodiester glycosidase family protein, partial [Thermoleophilaceae bacterium]